MPFTLSHPAAVAPLRWIVRRDRLPLEAVVIGAMSPDFEYLLRLEPLSLVSHSMHGLLVFCLPVGLLTLALWVSLLRVPVRALFALLPSDGDAPRTVAWWGRAALALLVGSATHLFWDAFTHRDEWGPVIIPSLRSTAFTIGGVGVPLYNVLQHVSSLVGGIVVGIWLWRKMQRDGAWPAIVAVPWRQGTWIALGAVALAVGAWNADGRGIMLHSSRATIVLGRIAVGVMVGFSIGLVIFAAIRRGRGMDRAPNALNP